MVLGALLKKMGIIKGRLTLNHLAAKFLSGNGIEIGPLVRPTKLPPGTAVKYVDRLSVEQMKVHYPEIDGKQLTPIDIIDDGEKLVSFADESLDFIVASHFLEHCQDPLTALENFCRVVVFGGYVLLAIPDKRFTFDKDRPITPLSHLLLDQKEGPEKSRQAHFAEWSRYVGKKEGAELQADIKHCTSLDYSIHFHVWTIKEIVELIEHVISYLPLHAELIEASGEEVLIVLIKDKGQSVQKKK